MEASSKNLIEFNFIEILRPYFIPQCAIGSARINVSNKVILPRSWGQKIYSSVNFTICCISLIYLTSRSAFYDIDYNGSILSILCYTEITSTLLLSGCPIVINNFFNVIANRDLFTKIQQIDKTLKINTNEYHYKYLFERNCFFVCFIGSFHGLVNIYIVVRNIGYDDLYLAIPAIFTLNSQDLEIGLFDTLIIFLTLRIKYINTMIKESTNIKWKSLNNCSSSTNIRQLYFAYRQILTVYGLVEKTFGHFLLLLVAHCFVNEMLGLERFLAQGLSMSGLTLFQTVRMILKVYIRFLYAACSVASLERSIAYTRVCCLQVVSNIADLESRRQVKNILRLLTPVRPMKIFSMFAINGLPIKLAAITATYAVVLLQFSFQAKQRAERASFNSSTANLTFN